MLYRQGRKETGCALQHIHLSQRIWNQTSLSAATSMFQLFPQVAIFRCSRCISDVISTANSACIFPTLGPLMHPPRHRYTPSTFNNSPFNLNGQAGQETGYESITFLTINLTEEKSSHTLL